MKNNPYLPNKEREKKKAQEEINNKALRKDMSFLNAGLNILVCFLLCGGAGYYIDHRLGTTKWTTIGVFFGLFVGFFYFIKFIIDAMRNK